MNDAPRQSSRDRHDAPLITALLVLLLLAMVAATLDCEWGDDMSRGHLRPTRSIGSSSV